ncbi:MAG: nicotinate-nucleotide adenylyltransferase [Thiobacillaceae bacterium]
MQAIGIFGGTFDPIHYGHLRLAEEMADALNLREVRFIPAGFPPHRAAPRTSAQHRLEMVRRAIAGNPRFVLDEREVRAARTSYTVDTLAELRSELGAQQPLCLLLGADAFLGLPGWHQWQRLFDLAHIAVAQRPGSNVQTALPEVLQREMGMHPAGSVCVVDMTPLAISASAIRDALAQQKSVRYLLPDSVLDYLQQQQLYKS